MSTIFNVRNLKLPNVTRTTVIIGAVVVVLALVAGVVGWQLYKKLTNNTVVAYFSDTLALYPGDKIQIMGVKVGSIDSIEPAGDKMKVTFHYENKYKVPANATASILNPSLVASRTIQLSPPYTGGPELENNATIPLDRTQVPVEYDELRDSINRILTDLGPTPEQPKGPFGDVIESFSNGLGRQGRPDQQDAQRPVRGGHHAQRGSRRLLRGDQEPGDVRQRAAQERPAVRRAEQRPRPVHELVHQHRQRTRDGAARSERIC